MLSFDTDALGVARLLGDNPSADILAPKFMSRDEDTGSRSITLALPMVKLDTTGTCEAVVRLLLLLLRLRMLRPGVRSLCALAGFRIARPMRAFSVW